MFTFDQRIWEKMFSANKPPGGYLSQNRPDFLGNGNILCHLNDMSNVVTGGCFVSWDEAPLDTAELKKKLPRCMRQLNYSDIGHNVPNLIHVG